MACFPGQVQIIYISQELGQVFCIIIVTICQIYCFINNLDSL